MTWLRASGGFRNLFIAGSGYDGSVVNFRQASQLGYLNSDRTITGVGAFADGVTGGTVDGAPLDTRVDLHGIINTGSFYLTDTISSAKWTLTLSGRYNHTTIDNRDRVQPAGSGSLTAVNSFGRFNPAIGFTFNPTKIFRAYASYSEGSRAPTSIELGCADPNEPCKLPNALTGDPPLRQVVTHSIEAGVRGGTEGRFAWSAGWFRAENHNDILFVASTQTGFGYFKNFGQTRRQGVEVNLSGRYRRLSLNGGYTFLNATYETVETVNGSSNSTNDAALSGAPGMDGTIQVRPGDRIPLIPQHMLKASAALQATRKLSLDLDFIAVSTSYARGNENNQSRPDGIYYLGPGTSPGYGVVNLGGQYQIRPKLQLFAQINNLLNHRYYTAAQLGVTGLTSQDTFLARPLPAVGGEFPLIHATFYAPGAPIGAWGGLRFRF
jgi:outer membrane receptor protein involved in Fe transport